MADTEQLLGPPPTMEDFKSENKSTNLNASASSRRTSDVVPLAPRDQYDTALSPEEETKFQQWRTKSFPRDSGADYDLRGAFQRGDVKSANGHLTDWGKKPNHRTYSVESHFAKDHPEGAGSWDGDTYIPYGQSNSNGLSSLAPLTTQALKPVLDVGTRPGSAQPTPPDVSETGVALAPGENNVSGMLDAYKSRNQQDDVPLDIDTGVPGLMRARLAFLGQMDKEVKVLQKQYGEQNVRMSDDGNLIVRTVDSKTGSPKDVLVDPKGTDPNDLWNAAAVVPEVVGYYLGTRYTPWGQKGKLPGMANKLKAIIAGSLGQEGAGAAKDIITSADEGQNLDLGDVAKRRLTNLPMDVGVGSAMGVAGKMTGKIISPFSNVTPEIMEARAAAEYWANRGLPYTATAAEKTGSPFLGRLEAYTSKIPGSSSVFDKIAAMQKQQVQKIQDYMMDFRPDAPSLESTGDEAMGALRAKATPAVEAANALEADAAQTGTREVAQALGKSSVSTPSVIPSQVGKDIRASAMAKREAFKGESNTLYGKVYAHPLAQQYNLDATGLANDAKDLLKKLPAPETITEKPTGILDKYGNAILRDEAGQKVMRNFVPQNVLSKLNDLTTLKGGKLRLGDLLKMRTDVSNEIAQGEAIPGMNTHYLGEIRGMLTKSIDENLSKLPDPELKNLWQAANKHYADNVGKFQKSGISELFRDPEQGNYLGDNSIVARAMQGDKGADVFNSYKEFFGATSPEFNNLKSAISERMFGDSFNHATGTINGGRLLQNLGEIFSKNPDVANEVFGKNAKQLSLLGKSLTATDAMSKAAVGGGNSAKILEQNFTPLEIQNLIKTKNLTYSKLLELADAKERMGQMYRNKIVGQATQGQLTADHINPSNFVEFMSTKADPSDIHHAVALISDRPEVLQDIKSRTVQQILDRATVRGGESVSARLAERPGEVTSSSLIKALGDSTQKDRYRAILGNETYTDLEQLAKLLGPKEAQQTTFSAAGGLAAGMQTHNMMHHLEKYVKGFIVNALEANAYTMPGLKAYLSNTTVTPANEGKIMYGFITSSPMITAMERQFGPKMTQKIYSDIKSGYMIKQADSLPASQQKQPTDYQDLLGKPPSKDDFGLKYWDKK